jgi:hypothetical protein
VLRTIAIALLAAALLAADAGAAEAPTREAYVARLEAICKPDALATQRVMKGAKADVRAEQLAVAARKFAKADAIYSGTVKQIAAVPRPEADAAKLSKWFTYLGRQVSYLERITAKLRQDNPIQAQRLTARFIHNGNLANNVVLAFGFDYCSFKFSRYG